MMKKGTRLFYILALLTLLLAACTHAATEEEDMSTLPNALVSEKYREIEGLTELADEIIVGALTRPVEYGSKNQTKYIIEVEEVIKGSLKKKSQIEVYAVTAFAKEKESEVLFLEQFDSEKYPNSIYILANPHLDIPVENKTITSGPHEGEKLDDIIGKIKKSPGYEKIKEKRKIKEKPDSLSQLIQESDYIIHIQTNDFTYESDMIRRFNYDLIQLYKGDERIHNFEKLSLPKQYKANHEYVVFLHIVESPESEHPSVSLTTRKGSVVDQDHAKQWEEVMKALIEINE